jgi:hypothetical protein
LFRKQHKKHPDDPEEVAFAREEILIEKHNPAERNHQEYDDAQDRDRSVVLSAKYVKQGNEKDRIDPPARARARHTPTARAKELAAALLRFRLLLRPYEGIVNEANWRHRSTR